MSLGAQQSYTLAPSYTVVVTASGELLAQGQVLGGQGSAAEQEGAKQAAEGTR
jgi:hypothetical protein